MAVTTQRATGAAEIRPFTIDFAAAELEDLRARIVATRWPEAETTDSDIERRLGTRVAESAPDVKWHR